MEFCWVLDIVSIVHISELNEHRRTFGAGSTAVASRLLTFGERFKATPAAFVDKRARARDDDGCILTLISTSRLDSSLAVSEGSVQTLTKLRTLMRSDVLPKRRDR